MKLSRRSPAAPRIEMLPLIDIVFLLLVFFIYAMLSMAVHRGQPVDLPRSGSAVPETQQAISITIQSVDRDMRLFVDAEPISLAMLPERLGKRPVVKPAEGEPEVQIFADKTVSYQQLFRVLDAVKQAGLTRISLQAKMEAGTP